MNGDNIDYAKAIWKYRIFVISLMLVIYIIFSVLLILNAFILKSQFEWQRWQGDNEMDFSQFSCFIPETNGFDVNGINTFRNDVMKKLSEASIDITHKPFVDCWSTEGRALVVSGKAHCTAAVTAIGGSFFDFHPLKLLSGSYISEDDMLKDSVVLDEDLAWFLFGGTDLSGLSIKVNGLTLMVTGVVQREQDYASKEAYSGSMGLFMNMATYEDMLKYGTPIDEYAASIENVVGQDDSKDSEETSKPSLNEANAAVTCYEICLPNPVKNFAYNVMQEKFPIKGGVITENSHRFTFGKTFSRIWKGAKRTMQDGVPRPYWENAAIYAESRASGYLVTALAATLIPVNALISWFARGLIYQKQLLENDYIPGWKENIEEKVRQRQRKRWESQYEKITGHKPKDADDYYDYGESDFNR